MVERVLDKIIHITALPCFAYVPDWFSTPALRKSRIDSLHHLWPGWLLELDMAGLVGQVAANTQPVKPKEPTATPTPVQPAEESTVEKEPRT